MENVRCDFETIRFTLNYAISHYLQSRTWKDHRLCVLLLYRKRVYICTPTVYIRIGKIRIHAYTTVGGKLPVSHLQTIDFSSVFSFFPLFSLCVLYSNCAVTFLFLSLLFSVCLLRNRLLPQKKKKKKKKGYQERCCFDVVQSFETNAVYFE